MEYLSRVMKWITDQKGFQFHTKCRRLKLNHLYFADDMLFFGKGEWQSVEMILRELETFSRASDYTLMQLNQTSKVQRWRNNAFRTYMSLQVIKEGHYHSGTWGYQYLLGSYQQQIVKYWWRRWLPKSEHGVQETYPTLER